MVLTYYPLQKKVESKVWRQILDLLPTRETVGGGSVGLLEVPLKK